MHMCREVWKKEKEPWRIKRKLTGAVKLNRRKTELLGDVCVLYLQSFVHLKIKAHTQP